MVIDPLRRKATGEAYADSIRRKQDAEKTPAAGDSSPQVDEARPGEKIEVSDKAILMGRIQRALAEIAVEVAQACQGIRLGANGARIPALGQGILECL